MRTGFLQASVITSVIVYCNIYFSRMNGFLFPQILLLMCLLGLLLLYRLFLEGGIEKEVMYKYFLSLVKKMPYTYFI